MALVREHLAKTEAKGKPGVLGFCYGGLMSVLASHSDIWSCGVSIHGIDLNIDVAKDIKVPVLFMPAGDDPILDPVEAMLKTKPVGKNCVFHRFDNMVHGFAAARGNWEDLETKKCIQKALSLAQEFLQKFIH